LIAPLFFLIPFVSPFKSKSQLEAEKRRADIS